MDGLTALHFAASAGDLEACRLLTEDEKDLNEYLELAGGYGTEEFLASRKPGVSNESKRFGILTFLI